MFNEIIEGKKISMERLDSLLENILKSKGLDEAVMLDTIKILREQGAFLPNDEQTLRIVEKNGNFMVAWYLVENGAKIYFELIVSALKNYKIEFFNYLIDKEPKLLLQNDTILCTAINIGMQDVVKKILNLDEAKKVFNIWHLITAIQNHQDDMFELLIKYYEKEILNNDFILEVAIKERQVNMVNKLINIGLDITPNLLFTAISIDSDAIVKFLLDKKEFDIDIISEALEKASDRKSVNTHIIKALLSKKHSKKSVKNSIKIIKKRKKETWVPVYIKYMNLALAMLRKNKNTI